MRPWSSKIKDHLKDARKWNKRKGLLKMLSDLINLDEPVSDILEFFESQEDILFAVVLQNMLHPNNSNRTEAIKNRKYVEITSLQTACEFIEETVRSNLTNQLRQAHDDVKQAWEKLESVSELRLIV